MVLTRLYSIYRLVHTSTRRIRVMHSFSYFLHLRLHGLETLTACNSAGFYIDGLDIMKLEDGIDVRCSLSDPIFQMHTYLLT